jgi:hypothetical protein
MNRSPETLVEKFSFFSILGSYDNAVVLKIAKVRIKPML